MKTRRAPGAQAAGDEQALLVVTMGASSPRTRPSRSYLEGKFARHGAQIEMTQKDISFVTPLFPLQAGWSSNSQTSTTRTQHLPTETEAPDRAAIAR